MLIFTGPFSWRKKACIFAGWVLFFCCAEQTSQETRSWNPNQLNRDIDKMRQFLFPEGMESRNMDTYSRPVLQH